MDYIKRNRESVLEWVNSQDDCTLVYLWNQKCDNANDGDGRIFYNDEEFFEVNFKSAMDAVRAVAYGDFTYTHTWVRFDGYANLETTDSPSNFADEIEIADDILENEQDYSSYITLEDEPVKVMIVQKDEDVWEIVDEEGDVIDSDHTDYDSAFSWLDGDDDYELVESFDN